MTLRVAVQMDPIERIGIDGDSTFVLMLEAQARGHALWHYQVKHLSMQAGRVIAHGYPVKVRREKGNHFTFGDPVELDLAKDVDVVLMRQNPPFDMAYITATHLLEFIHPKTLVVNDPASVRNAPEKLFVLNFPELMPDTLVSADMREIQKFRMKHGDIIVKPLFGNGGVGVFHLQPTDSNLYSLIEMFTERSREPLMIQQYLPAVREGDKRIILVNGVAMGAINRVPPTGDTRGNLRVGGRPEPTKLTERELEICATIGPALRERGLIFVGIDVIGGYLTEINVTSPTGLQELARFDGIHLERAIWDVIEEKRRAA